MPLPREQSNFDYPGSLGIVQGSGYAAAAAAESQVAKAIGGLGDQLYNDAGKLMAQKGRDDALATPMERGAMDYEEFTRNPDGSVMRAVVRDAQGKILPPRSTPYAIGFYDQAYHAAATERYKQTVLDDGRTKATEIANRFPNDPAQFSAAWSAYRQAQLQGLAVPFMGPAAVVLEDVGQQFFRGVVANRAQFEYKQGVESHVKTADQLERDVSAMVASGRPLTDPEVQRSSRAYIDQVQRGATLGYYTKTAADEQVRLFNGRLTFTQLVANIYSTLPQPKVTPEQPAPPGKANEPTKSEPTSEPTKDSFWNGNEPRSWVSHAMVGMTWRGRVALDQMLEKSDEWQRLKDTDKAGAARVLKGLVDLVTQEPENVKRGGPLLPALPGDEKPPKYVEDDGRIRVRPPNTASSTDIAEKPRMTGPTAEKPASEAASIVGRQRIEQFIKGDMPVQVWEPNKDGEMRPVWKKASEVLSLEERQNIAAKGSAVLEFSENTRQLVEKLSLKIATEQAARNNLRRILDAQNGKPLDMKQLDSEMTDLAQQGRPDLAISQFSFARAVERWQRGEQDYWGRMAVASYDVQQLNNLVAGYVARGFPNPWEQLSPEMRASIDRSNPEVTRQFLGSVYQRYKEMENAMKVSKPMQDLLTEFNAARVRASDAVKKGLDARGITANLEQTDERAKLVTELIQEAHPGHVIGKDPVLDRKILKDISGMTGVIDYRAKGYIAQALVSGDPKMIDQAIGYARMIIDQPNLGQVKLEKLLGQANWDAVNFALNEARNGRLPSSMADKIQEIAMGNLPKGANKEAIEAHVKEGMAAYQRFWKESTGVHNFGVAYLGPKQVPMPIEMKMQMESEIRRLAFSAGNDATRTAELAWNNVNKRWHRTDLVWDPAMAAGQPASPKNWARFLIDSEWSPVNTRMTAWSDKAPEATTKLTRDEIVHSTKAQIGNQFLPGHQFKDAKDIVLGENAWLTNPEDRTDGDGVTRRYWNVRVNGAAGTSTLLHAKPGTSASNFMEVQFDDENARAMARGRLETNKDTAIAAEEMRYRKDVAPINRMKIPAIGTDNLKAWQDRRSKEQQDHERRVDLIKKGSFNPSHYGLDWPH